MRTHHFFFAVFLSCFLVFGQAHAGWVPVATVNEKTPGHLCDVDDNGLDLFCGGNNPQLLANGGISSTSISTTVISFQGVTATSVLGAGGNFIVSGTTSVSASNAGTIKFATGGSERMVIDGTGNVGIGTSSPDVGLDIETDHPQLYIGKANEAGLMRFARASDGGQAGRIGYANATESEDFNVFSQGGSGFLNLGGQSHIQFRTGGDFGAAQERMRIDSSGNVGIGTGSPSTKLEVNGGYVTLRNTASVVRFAETDETNIWWLVADGNNFSIRKNNNSPYHLTADDNGNVGIGDSTPDYKLDVAGTAYATGAAGALSDRRHKKAIADLPVKGLETITKLRPVQFEWKDPQDAGMEGAQFGFIAQEVEQVLPQVILTQDDEEQTKGMKPTALIPVLTKAIQELKAESEEKDAEINALKAENAAFRQELDNLKQMLEAR